MKQWRIKNRILFLALLPGVLATLALGLFFINERWQDLDDLLESRTLTLAKHLAPTCEYGVITGNNGILQNIANSMLEEQDVRSVSIFNKDLEQLAHAGPLMLTSKQAAHDLQDGQLYLLRTSDSIRVRTPILAQNLLISDELSGSFNNKSDAQQKVLGWVEVELSMNNTRLLRYQHVASALGIILLVLLFSSLVAIRTSRNITVPVSQLIRALKNLEFGKLSTRVSIRTGGELGQLASGINAMASALERTHLEYQNNLKQATQDLQDTLDEMEIRNSELQIGRREALEASMMKSEFLANVSHEIRTPLNGIIGFSELLARTQINERQADYLDTIRKSSADLLKILNDILDLSKIDAGKLTIDNIDMNLRSTLEEVLTMLAPMASTKDLELNHLIYSDVPIFIRCDPLRLKQILTNIINNALKFTEQGSISIRVSVINKNKTHASLRFEVQDTGIGMSEAQISKLFTPFSQADASIARKFGGSGLGLIISRALIEAMNGEIRVTSQLGRGSVFSFYIEVGLQERVVNELPAMPEHRIALLESSMPNRMNTANLLSQWQLAHDDFENPTQLFEYIEQQGMAPWHCLIFSTRLSPSDRFLAQQITALTKLNIPILLLSNAVQAEHLEAYKKLGAQYVLSQPYAYQNLYRLLRQALHLPMLLPKQAEANGNNRHAPQILVVDDNSANIKLLNNLLKDLGLNVLSANSGAEAIVAVKNNEIDLIFMDIQMPGMSGLEATLHIRALQDKGNMPIVALTAHALTDEKEALLKAGMNDYQTKPISQEQLADSIERWTGYRCTLVVTPELKIRSEKSDDQDIFNPSLALRHANDNVELAIDMFSMLLEPMTEDMQRIMEAWEEENFDALLELVHKMHGASCYCGVPNLQQALQEFEVALKSGHFNQWPDLMRNLVESSAKLQHWASVNNWRHRLALLGQNKLVLPS